jgi:hypothetical protein
MATCFSPEGLFDRLMLQLPSAIAAHTDPMPGLYSQHEESNR